MVLLGASGCGKSTMLRMVAGLEQLTRGEIWISGRRVDLLPPGQRDVAMVFQSYALYPHMTVRDNMSFGLKKSRPSRRDRKGIAVAAQILEMKHLLDRKPSELSGGQRQRVAIGRAIVREPKAFLFDEPLSNLDAALRTRTRVELAQLHERIGATMIFVTHDQVEAMTLADRIVLFHDRRIVQVATPSEIYARPATRYVAQFIGSPGMNFVKVASAGERAGFLTAKLIDGSGYYFGSCRRCQGAGPDTGDRGRVSGGRKRREGRLKAQVETIERLGDRSLVHAILSDGSKVIGADPGMTNLAHGDAVIFNVNSPN